MKWIIKFLVKLPTESLVKILLLLAREMSKRTDNTVDDELVVMLEQVFDDIEVKEIKGSK